MLNIQCVRCKRQFGVSGFYTGRNRDGSVKRDSSCKACRLVLVKKYHAKNIRTRLAYAKSYRLKHRDRLKEYCRRWWSKNKEGIAKYKQENNSRILCIAAKNRAKKRRLDFDLTIPWVEDRIKTCALTGITLTRASGKSRSVGPLSPSIDRINSKRGYTMCNCRIVCFALNSAFQDWGADEFKPIAEAWLKRLANAKLRSE